MLLWPDPTLGKTIWSIVPPADSDARKDGKDIMFTLCSEECGDQLKETLEIEKDLDEAFTYNMSPRDHRQIRKIIYEHFEYIEQQWDEFQRRRQQ
jgi:hypothetical protein